MSHKFQTTGQSVRVAIPSAPGSTVMEYFWFRGNKVIESVSVFPGAAGFTTTGTYTLTVSSDIGSAISGGSYDITSATPAVVNTLTLSAVPNDVNIASGAFMYVTVASNNVDLTGTGLVIQIHLGDVL